MRMIDADALYEQLQKNEELARKRVLDTESWLPYPNNINPAYTRYVAQMDERTRLKHMVADVPTIEPERKKGKWIGYNTEQDGWKRTDGSPVFMSCSECNGLVLNNGSAHWNYCPNCGAKMEAET